MEHQGACYALWVEILEKQEMAIEYSVYAQSATSDKLRFILVKNDRFKCNGKPCNAKPKMKNFKTLSVQQFIGRGCTYISMISGYIGEKRTDYIKVIRSQIGRLSIPSKKAVRRRRLNLAGLCTHTKKYRF